MRPWIPLRLAAGLMAIFAAGHSVGMLMRWNRGPQEEAVLQAMRSFRFQAMGFERSHWDFYRGLGWFLSLTGVLFVVSLWQVSRLAQSHGRVAAPLIATFSIATGVAALLNWTYFFTAPAVVCTAAALCVGLSLKGLRLPDQ